MNRPTLLEAVKFNAQGRGTGEVLMMALMNAASLAETLATGQVRYLSRSRQALWRKGETSAHWQRLVKCRLDCDGDAVLLLVEQKGTSLSYGRA